MTNTRFVLQLASCALLHAASASAAAPPSGPEALELSLEELMSVVVTSVAKKPQTLAVTAAAVHVIQAEDIRRSGATSIPEALRLAPGVQVSAIAQNKWSVAIRGFADRFNNKLLVLVDGRSVYTPLFSGVLWETLDVPLETIARIEVIRGPGASIWGANAVNGVINIITRGAFESTGARASVTTGSELRGQAFARYGWNPEPDTAVRIHATAHHYGPSVQAGGATGVDNWNSRSAGFKVEHLLSAGSFQLQGGIRSSRAGEEFQRITAPPAVTLTRQTQRSSGVHLLARWEVQRDEGVLESLQTYVEQSDLEHPAIEEHRRTFDLEFQQRRPLAREHEITWGLAYRYSSDQLEGTPTLMIADRERKTALYSAFVQDEITLAPERWRLSLGARLEHNGYTGLELQPNLRLSWTPDAKSSAWLSLARATRSPSRIERGGAMYVQADPQGVPPLVPPSAVLLVSEDLGTEKLDGLDVGWRRQLDAAASLDLAAFYYRYRALRGAAASTPLLVFPPGYLLIEARDNNANSGLVRGVEARLDWRPTPAWRLQLNGSWLDADLRTADRPGQVANDASDTSPSRLLSLRSSLDLRSDLRWDVWLRHTSSIKAYAIPAFAALDMRLAWQAARKLEVALVGQNLQDDAHLESSTRYLASSLSEIQRSVYLKIDWTY